MSNRVIARQPISDSTLDVIGYALLYRPQQPDGASPPVDDPALVKCAAMNA